MYSVYHDMLIKKVNFLLYYTAWYTSRYYTRLFFDLMVKFFLFFFVHMVKNSAIWFSFYSALWIRPTIPIWFCIHIPTVFKCWYAWSCPTLTELSDHDLPIKVLSLYYLGTNWYIRLNPEDRINRKPEDRILDRRTEEIKTQRTEYNHKTEYIK